MSTGAEIAFALKVFTTRVATILVNQSQSDIMKIYNVDNGVTVILASQSMVKLELLHRIGAECRLHPVSLPWDPLPKEKPSFYAQRRARDKVQYVANQLKEQPICATSRVLAMGSRCVGPMNSPSEVRSWLAKLSGRSHRLYTALALRLPSGAYWTRICETRVTLCAMDEGEQDVLFQAWSWHVNPVYDPNGVMGPLIRSIHCTSAGCFEGVPLGPTYRLLKSHGLITCSGYQDPDITKRRFE